MAVVSQSYLGFQNLILGLIFFRKRKNEAPLLLVRNLGLNFIFTFFVADGVENKLECLSLASFFTLT
jgi:hypothetical protein